MGFSDAYGPVTVSADRMTDEVGEQVQVHREGSGTARLTFARLAWPGYTASIDGRAVDVRRVPPACCRSTSPPASGTGH